MSRTKWSYCYLSYSLNDYAWGELDDALTALAEQFQGQNVGNGTGFGFRDIDLRFPTRDLALEFWVTANMRFDKLIWPVFGIDASLVETP